MSTFKLKVTHDTGSMVLIVTASSQEAAVKMVCNMEKCPKGAVELIS